MLPQAQSPWYPTAGKSHPIRSNWLGNILHSLFAGEIKRHTEFAAQLVVGSAGNEHAPRIAKLLQTRRYVHTITQQVLALDHHVAEIDANAENDPPLAWDFDLLGSNAFLNGNRTGHGIDHRGELYDCPVAHKLNNPPVVVG